MQKEKNNLELLEKKLENFQQQHEDSQQKPYEANNGSIFIVAEIVAGISVGSFIGYNLDQYLHTKILFLLIFVILGLISSLYNIYRKYK